MNDGWKALTEMFAQHHDVPNKPFAPASPAPVHLSARKDVVASAVPSERDLAEHAEPAPLAEGLRSVPDASAGADVLEEPLPLEDGVVEESMVYRTTREGLLAVSIFLPNAASAIPRACLVLFHGGGWRRGSPRQFSTLAALMARRGMVVMCPEYRLLTGREEIIPQKAISDARAIMRWARRNAGRFALDPKRIGAGGASTGAHLALMAALQDEVDHDESDDDLSSRPDALVLLNPPLDFDAYESLVSMEERRLYSPMHLLSARLPPTVILHGTNDRVIPFRQIEQFHRRAVELGVEGLHVVPFEGRAHGFFNTGRGEPGDVARTAREMSLFLTRIGWMA